MCLLMDAVLWCFGIFGLMLGYEVREDGLFIEKSSRELTNKSKDSLLLENALSFSAWLMPRGTICPVPIFAASHLLSIDGSG